MKAGSAVFLIFIFVAGAFAWFGHSGTVIPQQTEEIQALEEQLDARQSESETLENETNTLHIQLEAKDQEIQQARQEEQAALQNLENLQTEINTCRDDLSSASIKLQEAVAIAAATEAGLAAEQEKTSTLFAEKENLERKYQQLATEYQGLSQKHQNVLLVNQRLQGEINDLQQQWEEISVGELLRSNLTGMSIFPISVQDLSVEGVLVIMLILAVSGLATIILILWKSSRKNRALSPQSHGRQISQNGNGTRSPSLPEMVTIQMTRQQLSDYVKWQRRSS